jgi:transcriptional regulator with XRE-family HTH domain
LADELDISFKHLSKIERDEVVFSVDILRKIADYFDVSSDYILNGSEKKISKEEIMLWIDNHYVIG